MEAPWLPTVVNILADIPWHCSVIKDLMMYVSVGQVLKDLSYLHLALWLLRYMCCTERVSNLSLSVSGACNWNIYSKGVPAMFERMGGLV